MEVYFVEVHYQSYYSRIKNGAFIGHLLFNAILPIKSLSFFSPCIQKISLRISFTKTSIILRLTSLRSSSPSALLFYSIIGICWNGSNDSSCSVDVNRQESGTSHETYILYTRLAHEETSSSAIINCHDLTWQFHFFLHKTSVFTSDIYKISEKIQHKIILWDNFTSKFSRQGNIKR